VLVIDVLPIPEDLNDWSVIM